VATLSEKWCGHFTLEVEHPVRIIFIKACRLILLKYIDWFSILPLQIILGLHAARNLRRCFIWASTFVVTLDWVLQICLDLLQWKKSVDLNKGCKCEQLSTHCFVSIYVSNPDGYYNGIIAPSNGPSKTKKVIIISKIYIFSLINRSHTSHLCSVFGRGDTEAETTHHRLRSIRHLTYGTNVSSSHWLLPFFSISTRSTLPLPSTLATPSATTPGGLVHHRPRH